MRLPNLRHSLSQWPLSQMLNGLIRRQQNQIKLPLDSAGVVAPPLATVARQPDTLGVNKKPFIELANFMAPRIVKL